MINDPNCPPKKKKPRIFWANQQISVPPMVGKTTMPMGTISIQSMEIDIQELINETNKEARRKRQRRRVGS